MLPIITGPASILPPASAPGSVLGSTALMQYPRATGTALPAGEQGWKGQGAGCAGLVLSSQGTARLCWVLLVTWRARELPQGPPCALYPSPLPPVMGCQGTAQALGLRNRTSHVSKLISNSVLQGSSSRHCMNQMKIVRWIPANVRLQTSLNIRAT